MLARIAGDRDIDAVVVHKIDRLARNMEDHVAIRALLRRRGVALVSVTENVEETASGRLVEGIHALMAEFYSANLASEIKKGQDQKAKLGGFPHGAPLGYLNVREVIGGRPVARIVPDPERAPLVRLAFELYATGEWTLQRLATELAHRGLTNRGQRSKAPAPITWQGLAKILANPVYIGIVEWNGVQYPGTHEPLVTPEVFRHVRELLGARSGAWHARAQAPPSLEGAVALRGMRAAALGPAVQRSLCLFLLPGSEERPRGHLSGALRRCPRPRSSGRGPLRAHPAPAVLGAAPA